MNDLIPVLNIIAEIKRQTFDYANLLKFNEKDGFGFNIEYLNLFGKSIASFNNDKEKVGLLKEALKATGDNLYFTYLLKTDPQSEYPSMYFGFFNEKNALKSEVVMLKIPYVCYNKEELSSIVNYFLKKGKENEMNSLLDGSIFIKDNEELLN